MAGILECHAQRTIADLADPAGVVRSELMLSGAQDNLMTQWRLHLGAMRIVQSLRSRRHRSASLENDNLMRPGSPLPTARL